MKKHNFSAGPCILPQEVLQQASEAILNFNNDDLSLIEISHRSQPFVDVMDKAIALVKELLEVPNGYSILFLQGGASLEFLIWACLHTNSKLTAYLKLFAPQISTISGKSNLFTMEECSWEIRPPFHCL